MIGTNGLGDGSRTVSSVGGAVGTGIIAIAPFTGPLLAPFVAAGGAIVAATGVILGALGVGKGCGESCIVATNVANQIELAMQENLAAYKNGAISWNIAVSNFDQLWNALVQGCGQVQGDAGTNCIGERQRGGKWDWFSAYRDSLGSGDSDSGGLFSSFGVEGDNSLLVVGGLALVAGLVVMK